MVGNGLRLRPWAGRDGHIPILGAGKTDYVEAMRANYVAVGQSLPALGTNRTRRQATSRVDRRSADAPGPGASQFRTARPRAEEVPPCPALARPDRRRLLRVVGVGLVGIAVGVGATLAAHGLGGGADRAASVQRLDLPAGGVAPAAPTPGEATASAPVRAGSAGAAVQRFLEAGAAGDAATAYGLLDRAGRKRYPVAGPLRACPGRPGRGHGRAGRARAHDRGGQADVTVTLSHRRPSTRSPGWSPPGRSRCGGPAARTAAGGSRLTRCRSAPTCPATTAPPRR